MAKKSSKNQPKRPSTTDFNNAAPPAVTTTNQPVSISFLNFITIATTENFKKFLKFAATTPEGENLVYLWKHAYEDGFENGRKSLLQDLGREMAEKFEEGVEKGMDLGREEGYTIAKEAFDKMVMKLKTREAPKASTVDANAQTDPPAITTMSISTQTNPTMFAVVSPSPAPFENRENSKIHSTSENLPNITVISSSAPPIAILNPVECSTTTTAFETCPTTTGCTQKLEKHPIATQKTPESVVSTRFNWADDANSFPISSMMPTKYPRDLSGLRSSSANPFSSLRRRCRNRKKPRHFVNFWSQPYCQHILPSPRYHTSVSHSLCHNRRHSSQPSSSVHVSLNWDQDPRLADLSNALRALGWVRH